MKTLQHVFLATSIAALAACATPAPVAKRPATASAPSADAAFAQKLDKVLLGSWRSDQNAARDQYRHPRQTLAFFGLKPGQTVIELAPSAGWYAEILAPLYMNEGHYIGAAPIAKADGEYARETIALRKRFADEAEHFAGAQLIEFDPKAPSFGAPASADVVLTFRNTHNWTDAGTAPVMYKAIFDVLKRGGTLGVVDHRANADADPAKLKHTGYLTEAAVIKLASDAGFKFVAKSEVNANPKDTRDWPKGVWTLPPSFALKDVDRAKYAAIGESDRMTLKFVKP